MAHVNNRGVCISCVCYCLEHTTAMHPASIALHSSFATQRRSALWRCRRSLATQAQPGTQPGTQQRSDCQCDSLAAATGTGGCQLSRSRQASDRVTPGSEAHIGPSISVLTFQFRAIPGASLTGSCTRRQRTLVNTAGPRRCRPAGLAAAAACLPSRAYPGRSYSGGAVCAWDGWRWVARLSQRAASHW
jgi:hypothetical protein